MPRLPRVRLVRTDSMLTDAASLEAVNQTSMGKGRMEYKPSVVVVSVDVEYLLALYTHDTNHLYISARTERLDGKGSIP